MVRIADIAFTPSAANQDVSACSEAVLDAEVWLFIAFIWLEFPFCNKSHVVGCVVFFLQVIALLKG